MTSKISNRTETERFLIVQVSNVYEREAIEKHLGEKGTSPITGDKAFVTNVFANKQLKKEIEAYCMVNNISIGAFDGNEGNIVDTGVDADIYCVE